MDINLGRRHEWGDCMISGCRAQDESCLMHAVNKQQARK